MSTTVATEVPSKPPAELAYQTAVQLLIHEGTLVWSRFNVFLVANSVLIAAMGVLAKSGGSSIWLSVCFVLLGCFLCFLWFVLTWRGFHQCGHYCTLIRGFENQLPGASLSVLGRHVSFGKGWGRIARCRMAQPNYVAYWTVCSFVILYLALFAATMCSSKTY